MNCLPTTTYSIETTTNSCLKILKILQQFSRKTTGD